VPGYSILLRLQVTVLNWIFQCLLTPVFRCSWVCFLHFTLQAFWSVRPGETHSRFVLWL